MATYWKLRWLSMSRSQWLLPLLVWAPLVDAAPSSFQASYRIEHRGLHVADARFVLQPGDQPDEYSFRNDTRPRGLASLVRRRRPSEVSTFRVDGEHVVPLTYELKDGTRKGEDNLSVIFDWPGGTAKSTYRGVSVDLPLDQPVLTRLALQVTVMTELNAGRQPTSYLLAHRNELKRYDYRYLGSETLDTKIGPLETERYVQQREGSSRRILLWLAPELGFLPVRMEQQRKEKTRTVFTVLEVSGLPEG